MAAGRARHLPRGKTSECACRCHRPRGGPARGAVCASAVEATFVVCWRRDYDKDVASHTRLAIGSAPTVEAGPRAAPIAGPWRRLTRCLRWCYVYNTSATDITCHTHPTPPSLAANA